MPPVGHNPPLILMEITSSTTVVACVVSGTGVTAEARHARHPGRRKLRDKLWMGVEQPFITRVDLARSTYGDNGTEGADGTKVASA